MDLIDRIRTILEENKHLLTNKKLQDFINQLQTNNNLQVNDFLSFANNLLASEHNNKELLYDLSTQILQELTSQVNFNYFRLNKKAPAPEDDQYILDFSKTRESDSVKIFLEENLEQSFPKLWYNLSKLLADQGRLYEAAGTYSVYKKVEKSNIKAIESIDKFLNERFGKQTFDYVKKPDISFIMYHNKNIDDLKRTIRSIIRSGRRNQKEMILLVDDKNEAKKIISEEGLTNLIHSIENEENIVKYEENKDLNIRLVIKGKNYNNQWLAYNVGALKGLESGSKYLSFISSGDILEYDYFDKLKKSLKGNKKLSLGRIKFHSQEGNTVDDVLRRWENYLHSQNPLETIDDYNLVHLSNHIIKKEALEIIVNENQYVFDPRLDMNSAEHEFLRRFKDKYGKESIEIIQDDVASKPRMIKLRGENPKAKNVILVGSTMDNTHGVPVVMNNIGNNLSKEDFNVFYLINNFDSKKIKLYDSSRNQYLEAPNREELLDIIKSHDPQFLDKVDVIHSHTWHIFDDFLHFHTGGNEDPMQLKSFLRNFRNAKFVYTDHSNPTEDLDNINNKFDVSFHKMTSYEKKKFLSNNKLKRIDDNWVKHWMVTSINGKKAMSDIADVVVNVSNAQHTEGKQLIPDYSPKRRETLYNGIDLFRYTDDNEISKMQDKIRERYSLTKEDNLILYAGRISTKKGAYDLMQALTKLRKSNTDYKLLIAGNVAHTQKAKIKAMLGKESKKVVYLGNIKDRKELASIYKTADLTVQPTHGECFNQVVGESLSQGTPVITTDYSGPGEVYVKKKWAMGIKPKDIDGLSEKIRLVLKDKHNHRKHVERFILPKVKKELHVDAMVNQYAQLYKTI